MILLLVSIAVASMAQRSMGARGGFGGRGGGVRGGGFFGPSHGPVGPRFGPHGGFIGHPRAGIIVRRPGFGLIVGTRPRGAFGFHHHRRFFPHFFPGSFCALNPFACAGTFGFNGWNSSWIGWPGYGLPYTGSYSDSPDAQVQATLAQQQQTIADLEDQIRQERLDRMQADAAQPSPVPPPPPAAQNMAKQPSTPTVLVFRDHRQVEVENYAIMGDTLYEFAQHWTRRIPLSDLDIPATVKLNEQRGVEFRVPSSNAQTVTHR